MKLYEVYVNCEKASQEAVEGAIFIKDGFSFYAMFFGSFWAIYYRLWSLSIIVLLVLVTLSILAENGFFSSSLSNVLTVVFLFFLGFIANDCVARMLVRKGMSLFDVVVARNEYEARRRFYTKYC